MPSFLTIGICNGLERAMVSSVWYRPQEQWCRRRRAQRAKTIALRRFMVA